LPKRGDYADVVRLLILTGQRETEVGDLAWSEVNLDRRTVTLPPNRVKNGREHTFPLSAPVMAILGARLRREGRDLVFGTGRGRAGFDAWSFAKEKLDAVLQLSKPWTVHDLRRSFSTGLGDLGFAPHIGDAITNHQSGVRSGVSGVYNRSVYEREARLAVDLWGETVTAAVEGREPTVVSLHRAG
jgi:integrase